MFELIKLHNWKYFSLQNRLSVYVIYIFRRLMHPILATVGENLVCWAQTGDSYRTWCMFIHYVKYQALFGFVRLGRHWQSTYPLYLLVFTTNFVMIYFAAVLMQVLSCRKTVGGNITLHNGHNGGLLTNSMLYAHDIKQILLQSSIQEVVYLKPQGKHEC